MKKINIMFLMLSLNVGGTEKHIFNLASRLNRERFNSVICCMFELGSMGKMLDSSYGVKVYHSLLRNKFDISGIWKLMNIIRKEKINILFTINSPLTQFWGTVLANLPGVGAFITRVCATNPTFHGRRRRVVNKVLLPFVDRVIAQAESHKEYLVASEGMSKEKLEVIYNGVELARFSRSDNGSALRESIGIPEDAAVVGMVARLAPEKGHDVFLKAAKKIIDEFPHAYFLIVGDGPEREKLWRLVQALTIEANIIFLGVRRDIPEILSMLDIAVLSSNPVVETFSNAILEYMAAGKPVVATLVGSTIDMVKEGETGFLVPCGDPEKLAQAILRLLKDRDTLTSMGKAGRKRVQEMFSLKGMVANYETLFESLVA